MNGRTAYPVYVSLGNWSQKIRSLEGSKRLLGFIPKVRVKSKFMNERTHLFIKELHNKSVTKMLEPIFNVKDGFLFKTHGRHITWVRPRICFFPLDWPESRKIAGLKNGVQAK